MKLADFMDNTWFLWWLFSLALILRSVREKKQGN